MPTRHPASCDSLDTFGLVYVDDMSVGGSLAAQNAHAHGTIDPDQDYKVKSIIGETKTHYLISWEDDEATGEKYDDTWEPKVNANDEAIADWNLQKAERKSEPVSKPAYLQSFSNTLSQKRKLVVIPKANPTAERAHRARLHRGSRYRRNAGEGDRDGLSTARHALNRKL